MRNPALAAVGRAELATQESGMIRFEATNETLESRLADVRALIKHANEATGNQHGARDATQA